MKNLKKLLFALGTASILVTGGAMTALAEDAKVGEYREEKECSESDSEISAFKKKTCPKCGEIISK